jgi:hypothetical protein
MAKFTPKMFTPAILETPPAPVASPQPLPSAPPPVKESALTFDMYCSVRKIPVMNRPGLRAYTKIQSASLPEWDRAFLTY